MKSRSGKTNEGLIDGFSQYLTDAGRSPVTVKNYRGDVLHAIEWLTRRFAWPFDGTPAKRAKLHHYRSHLAAIGEPATANRKIAAFNTFLGWAASQKYIEQNIPKLKSVELARKTEPEGLGRPEKEQLLRSVREKGTPSEELLFLLLLEHDLRVEQICALKWAHVDIEAGSLSLQLPRPKPLSATFRKSLEMLGVVQSPENERRLSTRVVPLNKEVAKLFREVGYSSKCGSTGLVFVRDRGAMTRRAVELMVARHSNSAGIKATVRTLSQTYIANRRANRDPFGFRELSSLSPTTLIPVQSPGLCGVHDSFNDLYFNDVASGLEPNLFVSAYSTRPTGLAIRKAVVKRANGKCERCGSSFGNPAFLDVHHIIPTESVDILEGIDTYNNCVALCPNCHREAHLKDRWEVIQAELKNFVQQFGPNPPDAGQPSGPQMVGGRQ